jgi:hypothetical protein
MTGTIPPNGTTDPERLFENGSIDAEERTYTHGDEEHYRNRHPAGTVGRTIVGITDADGRLLLLTDPEEGHALLPNDTVGSGENWTTVAREWVEGQAGVEVTIDGIERLRRVEHAIEGEETPRSHVHHVVLSGSVVSTAPGEVPLDELCADNPWELGWYEQLPFEVEDPESDPIDDVRLFLG